MKKALQIRAKKNLTFGEQYEVFLDYRREDGRIVSHREHVVVQVVHGVNEKNHHGM